jgi:hypothetical protein
MKTDEEIAELVAERIKAPKKPPPRRSSTGELEHRFQGAELEAALAFIGAFAEVCEEEGID